jgi:hypothetical protein
MLGQNQIVCGSLLVEPDHPPEDRDGSPDVQRLPLEAAEHTGLHRAAAAHHQQHRHGILSRSS